MVGEAAKYNSASKYAAPFTRRKSTPRLPRETLVVVLLLTQGNLSIMKFLNVSALSGSLPSNLLLILCLFLSACAGTMNGMVRNSGEPVSIAYTQNMQHDNLQVTMPDGEVFIGKAVQTDRSTGTIAIGKDFGVVESSTGSVQAVLFGNKKHTMQCKLQYANASGFTTDGGVGVCQTSNNKIIDVQW
jgi:hypothetical protein